MRKFLWPVILALIACGDKTDQQLGTLSSTSFTGTITLLSPVEGAEICAYALTAQGRSPDAAGCSTSDAQGQWSLKAGKLYGAVVFEARGGTLTSPLLAAIPHIAQFSDAGPVHLTPISHLTAGYAEWLVETKNATPCIAVQQAQTELNRHFGALPHHVMRPWMPSEDATNETPLAVTGAVQAHLFSAGIDTLARRLSARADIAEDTAITLQTVLDALYEDVRADGTFDGIGFEGCQLKQRELVLNENALRRDLADSMAQFLLSPRNKTGLTPAEMTPVLKAMAVSQGKIFSSASQSYSDEKPQLSSCHVVTQDGQISSLDLPQRGVIEVVCVWDDPSGIDDADIAVVETQSIGALTLLERDGGKVSSRVDTLLLEESLREGRLAKLQLKATNAIGFTAETVVSLHVLNSEPELNITNHTAAWIGRGEMLQISGTVDRPLRRATLLVPENSSIEGLPFEQEYTFESNTTQFDLVYPTNPIGGQTYQLTLIVEDWAGNRVTSQYSVSCDDTAPTIDLLSSVFRQEFSGKIIDLASGSERILIEKFFTSLDYLPEQGRDIATQNLPVIAFQVNDQLQAPIGTKPSALLVEYMYVMGGLAAQTRAWEPLSPDDSGVYRLPLSYQTLLPKDQKTTFKNFIARCSPDDLHRITIRVADLAGNFSVQNFDFRLFLKGPPLRVQSCTPSGVVMGAGLAAPNFVWIYQDGVRLFDGQLSYPTNLPAGSLAPWAPVDVKLETAPLQSRIQRIRDNWSVIAKGQHNDHLVWHRRPEIQGDMDAAFAAAKRCGNGKRVAWPDGLCWPLKKSLEFPFLKESRVDYQSQQPMSVVALDDADGVIAQSSPGMVYVVPDRPIKLRSLMGGNFKLPNGEVLNWGRVVDGADGLPAVQMKHLVGVEAEGPKVNYIERNFTIADLTWTRPGLQASIVPSQSDVPAPIGIDMDASCSGAITLTWDRNSTSPTVL